MGMDVSVAPATAEGNLETVRRAIAAYNRRDFRTIRELSHPDVVLDWSASKGLQAGVYRGPLEIEQFYRHFLETFEEVFLVAHLFVEHGDSIVVPNSTQIRGRGGIRAVARSALAFKVRHGRVARIRLYQKMQEALEGEAA
jgi:ketosteroid isomerase-like protein